MAEDINLDVTPATIKNRIIDVRKIKASELLDNPLNFRQHPENQKAAMLGVLKEIGATDILKVYKSPEAGGKLRLIDGHLRKDIAPDFEWWCAELDLTDEEAKKALATHDAITNMAEIDRILYSEVINQIEIDDKAVNAMLADLAFEVNAPIFDDETGANVREKARTLMGDYIIPPFSVIDCRQGYWQNRKKAWLALGMRSELGRGGHGYVEDEQDGKTHAQGLIFTGIEIADTQYYDKKAMFEQLIGEPIDHKEFQEKYYKGLSKEKVLSVGSSIFDPALCEIMYKWFCPNGGLILDPFAGGSVRGIVAGYLGYEYNGIDLSEQQVLANREQVGIISEGAQAEADIFISDPEELTPIERRGDFIFKRDDLFKVHGVRGGKVRTCLALAKGAKKLITAGSRSSPQVNIVAHIAAGLGIPAEGHTPKGSLGGEVAMAQGVGADIIQHKAGYNSVIIARAKEAAQAQDATLIPFGMECEEAVTQTRKQAANLPKEAKRIVIPVGSGMSLAGLLWGMKDNKNTTPVVGVVVGANPDERLDQYAPKDWRDMVTLVNSDLTYDTEAPDQTFEGVQLDPIYEAKCIPFLKAGDCLYVIGFRASRERPEKKIPEWLIGDSGEVLDTLTDESYDMVFSCPPYFDLEKYSDDPKDLSNMSYRDFLKSYEAIIKKACDKVKPNRFIVWVVSEIRSKKSNKYRGFVADTVKAFEKAGVGFYNDVVLVNNIGSLPIRASKYFETSRKLGRTHQNVLVFLKGDSAEATKAMGAVITATDLEIDEEN
mgnify:FL=1